MRLMWAILCLIFLSCGGRRQQDDRFVLRLNLDAGLNSLDPAFARDQNSIWMITQLYQTLVELDRDLIIKPALAHRWEVDEQGRRYTFFLDRGQRFAGPHPDSPGRRVLASDVLFSLQRLVDPRLASPGAWLLRDRIKQLSAPNDSVFVLELKEAFSPLLQILSMAYTSVIRAEAALVKDLRREPAGSGPYFLNSWKEGEALVLIRNLWHQKFANDAYPGAPEACTVTFNPDRYSAFLELLKGRIHLLLAIDGGLQNEILGLDGGLKSSFAPKVRLLKSPYLNTEYLGFGPELKGPWKRAEVRQALALLVDRTQLVRYMRNGIGTPGTGGMIPPGLAGHFTGGYAKDANRAHDLLEKAGYPKGVGLPPVELTVSPNYKDMGEFLVEQWSKEGLPVRLATEPGFAIREKMAKGGLDLFRASWIADYPDPENYLALFFGPNAAPAGPNYTRYQNELFNKLYKELAVQEHVLKAQTARAMDSLVMRDAPVVVLYYDQCARIALPGLQGAEPDPLNSLKIWELSWSKED